MSFIEKLSFMEVAQGLGLLCFQIPGVETIIERPLQAIMKGKNEPDIFY